MTPTPLTIPTFVNLTLSDLQRVLAQEVLSPPARSVPLQYVQVASRDLGEAMAYTPVVSIDSRKIQSYLLLATKIAASLHVSRRFAFASVSTLALSLSLLPNYLAVAPTVNQIAAVTVTRMSEDKPSFSAVHAVTSLPKSEPVSKLTNEQSIVSNYLSNRYKIATERTHEFVQLAFETGKELGLDPWLILAIMSVESSLNPKAVSNVGAQGLMQVHTRVHADKFAAHGGVARAFDPQTNIRVGAGILREYIGRHGGVKAALKAYVGAALLPEDSGYSAKVMNERERLAAVAGGRPFKEPAPVLVAQSFTTAAYLANASELSGSVRVASLTERLTGTTESIDQAHLDAASAELSPHFVQ